MAVFPAFPDEVERFAACLLDDVTIGYQASGDELIEVVFEVSAACIHAELQRLTRAADAIGHRR